MNQVKIDIAKESIQSLIASVGIKNFSIALNNALCHGKALKFAGYRFSDNQLQELFRGIDTFSKAAASLEKYN